MTTKEKDLMKKFPVDTWLKFEKNGEVRFSEAFIGWNNTYEPFNQLNDFDPDNYEIVTYKYAIDYIKGRIK